MSEPKRAKLFSLKYFLMDVVRVTGALPGLIWLRPKISYASEQAKKRVRGGALLISNHTGFLDPVYTMLILWYRRQYFVCHQVFAETAAGSFFRYAGCLIPIDAENFNMDSFRAITGSLTGGRLVTLFPEGHVNDGSGDMREFKSGMVLIAMQSRRPIVPVYIKARGHWYSRLKAVVGEPVDVAEMCGGGAAFKKIREATEMLQEREEQLKELAENI